jgi:hypothetical protein
MILYFLLFIFYILQGKVVSFVYKCIQKCLKRLFTVVNLALVTFVNTNENLWIIIAGITPIQSPD